jgi:hypothetical protein
MTVVLSADLAPLLEPTIDRIGIEGLAKRARAVDGFQLQAEAYYRRITELRAGRAVTVSAHRADVLLLACNDDLLGLTRIAHFPTNRSEAFHMVEVYFEGRGEQASGDGLHRLSESLIHFSTGLRDESVEASEAALARRTMERQSGARQRADKQALAA